MKTLIKINPVTSEITMSKATAQKASYIGTDEYNQLLQVKKDFPDFKVKVLSPKGKENSNKGLTIELMEKLIKAMTNNNQDAVKGFEAVKDTYKGTSFHFSKPKEFFLIEYPDWKEWLPNIEKKKKKEKEKQQEEQKQTESETVTVDESGISDYIKQLNNL